MSATPPRDVIVSRITTAALLATGLLVVLRLVGVVDWQWRWVLLPAWGPVVLMMCASGLALLWVLGAMALRTVTGGRHE